MEVEENKPGLFAMPTCLFALFVKGYCEPQSVFALLLTCKELNKRVNRVYVMPLTVLRRCGGSVEMMAKELLLVPRPTFQHGQGHVEERIHVYYHDTDVYLAFAELVRSFLRLRSPNVMCDNHASMQSWP
jgi:hypothetical protein